MTALVAADVTVTVQKRSIEGKMRRNRVKITFGDGALTYPANGIPMPAMGKFGMKQRLDYLTIFDENDAVGLVFKFDKENAKLRIWQSAGFTPAGTLSKPSFLVLTGTQGANMSLGLDADSASGNVTGGAGITANRTLTTTSPVGTPTLTGTAVAAAALVELGAVAVAAQTLYAEAVGW